MQILSAVNCSGARHKIGLSSKGKLVFFGHPDGLKEGCRCYEILEKWREHKTDKVPVKIREIIKKNRLQQQEKKMTSKADPCIDVLSMSTTDREKVYLHKLTEKSLFKALSQCDAWLLRKVSFIDFNFASSCRKRMNVSLVSRAMGVYGRPYTWRERNSLQQAFDQKIIYDLKLDLYIDRLPINWYKDIYKQGLAVVDGYLVLDIDFADKSFMYARIIRSMNIDGGVEIESARIKVNADGKKELQLLRNLIPQKKNHLSLDEPVLNIHCFKKRHKIGLHSSGSLIFYDHPNGFLAEKVLEALGEKSCECYEFLKNWKENRGRRPLQDKRLNLTDSRLSLKKTAYMDPLLFSQKHSAKIYLHKLTTNALQKCLNSTWKFLYKPVPQVDLAFDRSNGYPPFITSRRDCKSVFRHSFDENDLLYEYDSILIINYLSESWYNNIYKKGLAIIDGYVVIDINETIATVIEWKNYKIATMSNFTIQKNPNGNYSIVSRVL